MSALLLRQDSNTDVFVIEVVKKISRQMPVSVTTHPVENGSSVSDHAIRANKTFTIEGVISDATFESILGGEGMWKVRDALVLTEPYSQPTGSTVVKTNRPNVGSGIEPGTGITSRLKSLAGEHLGFITQFTRDPIKVNVTTPAAVTVAPGAEAFVQSTFSRAKDRYQQLEKWRDERVVVTLDHSSGWFENCVITGVEVMRDSSISDKSFVFTLQLEQIQIVDKAETVAIAKRKPKPAFKRPAPAVADLCSAKAEPGKQSTSPVGTSELLMRGDPAAKSAKRSLLGYVAGVQ